MTPNDEIRVEELEIFARVGVPDKERLSAQRLVVSLTLVPRRRFDELCDDVRRTIDYAAVCDELRRVAQTRADHLIETLADALAEHLLRHFEITRVDLELRKFALLETKFVAVRLTRTSER